VLAVVVVVVLVPMDTEAVVVAKYQLDMYRSLLDSQYQ
jgi:hypothetical protein